MRTRSDLFLALGALCVYPQTSQVLLARHLELAGSPDAASFTQTFTLEVHPYASVYLGVEGMLGGEARDRVAGFWRALGATPPAEPDHLAALLSLYGSLIHRESGERDPAVKTMRREARRALLHEHLLVWVPAFTRKVQEVGAPFYRAWAELLRAALLAEVDELGLPTVLPLHLRMVPGPIDLRTEPAGAVAALLAPARTGMVITRADLRRAVLDVGTGARVGERRFILQALIDYDAVAAFGWLADEARQWAAWHSRNEEIVGDIATHWHGRARATEEMLRACACEAEAVFASPSGAVIPAAPPSLAPSARAATRNS